MDTEEMMRIDDMNMYTPAPYMPYYPMMQQMPMQGQMAPGMIPGMHMYNQMMPGMYPQGQMMQNPYMMQGMYPGMAMPSQMMPGVYLSDEMSDMTPGMMMPGYMMQGMRYSDDDEDKVNASGDNIEEKVDENINIENEDEDDYMGFRAPQDVDRILRLIERDNPAIARRLINAGIPPYEVTRILRRIIALTLSHSYPSAPPIPPRPPFPPHR